MKTFSMCLLLSLAALLPVESWAQAPSDMSCQELWMARNQIYADAGYCFKTARAKAVFGEGCFPPYGQMNRPQQQRVAELQRWETMRTCPK